MQNQAAEARKPPSLMKIYPKLGHLGKQKIRPRENPPAARPKHLVMLAALAAASCSAGSGTMLYTGTLRPASGTCDPPGPATLRLNNDAVLFTPRDGTLILHGTSLPGGDLSASLVLPGIDKKPYQLRFEARRTPNAEGYESHIEGRYITPRCTYSLTLHRTTG